VLVDTEVSSGIYKNDIVIFSLEERKYCKRVIGEPGDVVEVKQKAIYVNSVLKYKARNDGLELKKIELNENEYYVIGDNVDNSYDNRVYGPIQKEQIIGKVIKIKHKS